MHMRNIKPLVHSDIHHCINYSILQIMEGKQG